MAIIYVKCGEIDKALDELEYLLSQQSVYTINDFKLNRNLDPLRNLPRYQDMIRRHGAPTEPA